MPAVIKNATSILISAITLKSIRMAPLTGQCALKWLALAKLKIGC